MLFAVALLLSVVHGRFIEEMNDDKDGLLFGGDMMLTPEQRIIVETGGDLSKSIKKEQRAIMSNENRLWFVNTNKTVPYTIDKKLDDEAEATMGIMKAFREWEQNSCIKFKRRDQEFDYINFFAESGCWSYVGRIEGRQNISLKEGCWGVGTIVHEIGHAVGFGHEQNRPDRDKFIKIRWENITSGKENNFKKYNDSDVDSLNSTYDYKSFMQYSKTAFGINNSVTLDPIQKDIFQLGQRVGFTESDRYQAMGLYKCNGQTTREREVQEKYILKGDNVCDFENGMCNYTQDSNDDFDWTRRFGGTPSGNTGPETDHTTGRLGVYVYIEATLHKESDKARLLSPVFPSTTGRQCLSFFLHMFAKNKTMMGDFKVYLKDESGEDKVLFEKSGSQNVSRWERIKLMFNSVGKYQIIFEGIRGSGYQGDIALDDISFTRNDCFQDSVATKKKDTLTADSKCEDTSDREGLYCQQWKDAGFCETRRKYMTRFCKKTCNFCQKKIVT